MKKHLLFLLLLTLSIFSFGQSKCSFDEKMKWMMESNPENARDMILTEQKIQQYIKEHSQAVTNKSSLISYTIPVVVHVMHTGGAVGSIYNPSDASILGAINYLNQIYAGTYAGMEQPVEGGGIVNMELQFALAQRTLSCGNTNGIDRVDASSIPNYTANGVGTGGCTDLELKNFARWNTADYYNIWVVNKIDGADGTVGQFTAGYAYFAGAPASLDGTVMLATQMLSGQGTLPHEIGHAFNLYHTFQGSNLNTQCPANTTCTTDGDAVCDTDPITNNVNASGIYSFVCRTGTNTCTSSAYTVNTEHNFMSYTNCFTLFTNGQKARTQAAMSLPSRIGFATSLGATPCGTVINFGLGADIKTEDNAGTTSGCRMYKDYTYQMSIGAAPSATATATLSYSGTAIKGLDYYVTTNGNFTAPSNVLTFNTGSTAAQTFTMRVYNDANVETAETAILNFTLNNGGGNASIGTSAPSLTVTLNDNDLAPVATSSALYTIGGLTNVVNGAPFNATIGLQRSQYLYKASELAAAGLTAGNINALQLFVNSKLSSGSFNNFTIKMAQTAINYLVDGSANVIGGMTTVHSVASLSTIAGWNNFNLTAPFGWDGVSNLAIELCYSSVTAGAAADQLGCYSDGGTAAQGNMMYQDNINCAGAFSSLTYYPNGVKPRIQLGLAVTGTPVETAAAATKSEHIVTGSSDYFYSNNNKLMAKISGVNAALGCVATTVENAGTTWMSFLAGQRSAKVYTITPTTNTTTTDYTLSLYFDNAELGSKTASTLRIAKTTAASIELANAGNTIFAVPAITTLGNNTVFTASFTGFSRFFLIDAAAVLPITLLAFNAYESNNAGILQWTTVTENNNKGFDVEKSLHGITFEKIAFVPGKGTSGIQSNYNLKDNNLTDVQYYRLKQIDTDGKFSYSNVVQVKGKPGKQRIVFITNPFNTELKITMANKAVKNITVELLDATGKTIIKRNGIGNNSLFTIPLPGNIAKGIYFVNVTVDGVRFGSKLMKE
jgi:Pregnancy-associated plasma protein-A/Secretion system C-terminal sorting domain